MFTPQHHRAKVLIDLKRPHEAVRVLVQLLAQDPEDHYAHYLMAFARKDLGKLSRAFSSIKEALRIEPGIPAYSVLYADLLSLSGEHEKGLQVIEAALMIAPEAVELHSTKGALLMRMGRFERAETALADAIALDPDNVHALQLGAFNAGVLSKADQEGGLIASALRADASNARSLAGLAWHDLLNGNPGDHRAAFQHALAKDPMDGLARMGLRLSTSWWPRYQVFVQRVSFQAQRRTHGFDTWVRLINIVLILVLLLWWASSTYRRDTLIAIFILPFVAPLVLLVCFPEVLQIRLWFSAYGRGLFRDDRFGRSVACVLFLLAACVLAVVDMATGIHLVIPALLCAVLSILVKHMRRHWFHGKQLLRLSLILFGLALMLPYAMSFDELPAAPVLAVFGGMLAFTVFIMHLEERRN